MHPYANPCQIQIKLYSWLALASMGIAASLAYLSTCIQEATGVTVAVAITSTTFMPILYVVFDKYLWKIEIIRRWLLVPNFNGVWVCTTQTAIKEGKPVNYHQTGTIKIFQSWSKMAIIFHSSGSSGSHSLGASILSRDPDVFELSYWYSNTPDALQTELALHTGFVTMRYDTSTGICEGFYFTDRHRQTYGKMTWQRIKEATNDKPPAETSSTSI